MYNPNQPRDRTGKWSETPGYIQKKIDENSGIDPKQKRAVEVYHSAAFESINNELRFDKPDRYKETIEQLDKASTDETEAILYRGLDSDYALTLKSDFDVKDLNNLEEVQQKLVGRVIKDKSFMSATTNLTEANVFAKEGQGAKGVLMQIEGKKKGIEVSKYLSGYRARQEQEFIIKRNTPLTITKVSISKSGKLILYTKS